MTANPRKRSRSISLPHTPADQQLDLQGLASAPGRHRRAAAAGRRAFLSSTAGLMMAGAVGIPLARAADDDQAAEADAAAALPNIKGKVLLRPDDKRDLYRVRVEMAVEGNVNIAANPMVSRKVARKIPLQSDAVFDYEERFRRPVDAAEGSVVTAAERFYHEAISESKVNGQMQQLMLRDEVRQTLVRRDSLPEVVYSPDDFFSHGELELLRVPASSIDLDRLLPEQEVGIGDSFTPDREAVCGVLNLTAVDSSDVTLKVVALNAKIARFELGGAVSGSVQGVPTQMDIVGKLTFDREAKMCYWLAMAVRESREISITEPGFEVTAKVQMLRKPQTAAVALPKTPAAMQITRPVPENQILVETGSHEISIAGLMDRRWRMMVDVPGRSMMRMIDNDRSVAQCDFRVIPALGKGKQWTLEAFERDIKKTMGGQISQLINAQERLSDSGLRVLRITAQGSVEGVPVQWILLHFSDDSGRRVLASFTMDAQSIEQFAGSDVQLADSLRFERPSAAAPVVEAGESTEVAAKDKSGSSTASRQATKPKRLPPSVR